MSDLGTKVKRESLILFYQELAEKFNLFFLEDPLTDNDWEGWQKLTSLLKKVLVVGDDLLCTNPERVKKAIALRACGGVVIKPNQIGTVSETIKVVALAKSAGLKTIVSHRSGETEDDFLADLAVGVEAEMVKFGIPVQKERLAKYHRLLKIEAEIK